MAAQICSKCGYEGRGKRSGERKGGGLFRLLGILTLLPVFTLWKLTGSKKGEMCLHCGLPTMVKLNSPAGKLAQRIADIELGLIQVKKPEEKVEEKKAEGFGNERSAERLEIKKPVNPEEW